jgi:hypothetical protein
MQLIDFVVTFEDGGTMTIMAFNSLDAEILACSQRSAKGLPFKVTNCKIIS